jgi:gliding motility-associated protein GldL
MGTEIAMFVLTAFDRPPKEYAWEDVFPVLDSHDAEDRPDFNGVGGGVVINGGITTAYTEDGQPIESSTQGTPAQGGIPSAQGAYAAAGIPASVALSEEDTLSLRESIAKMSAASEQLSQMAELTTATQRYLDSMAGIADQMAQLQATTQALNNVSETLLQSYTAITTNSDGITRSSQGYVQEMENLNRNVSGLNTIYEIQLRSISSQLESIDRVNRGLKDIRDMYEKSANESSHYCEETEKMARYMKQLNSVYEKMITAMTVNMYNPVINAQASSAVASESQEAPRPTVHNPFTRSNS